MNIPWDLIFDAIFKLIEDCGDTPEKRVEAVKAERSIVKRFQIRRQLRNLGIRGREASEVCQTILDDLEQSSDGRLLAFAQGGNQELKKFDGVSE